MENEVLITKVENLQKLVNELTAENEQLFQQFNHLMVRNGKLLKRVDDLQQIIDNMHLRIEELQLINGNLLKINDNLRVGNDTIPQRNDKRSTNNDNMKGVIDNLHRRIDELHLRNDVLQQRTNILSENNDHLSLSKDGFPTSENKSGIDSEKLFDRWKNYPGQNAKNAPNLRKQSQMLVHLFENKSLNAATLFQKTKVNGVTGARYVAVLKLFNLIEYKGARKKGEYHIAQKGIELIEKAKAENEVNTEPRADAPSPQVQSQKSNVAIENPDL